jgi:hypothetical protein
MNRYIIFIFIILLFSCRGLAPSPDSSSGAESNAGNIALSTSPGDSILFYNVVHKILNPMESSVPVNRRMVEVGKAFLGTPYVAATLEEDGEELLIVNLQGVDCTTFVEYVTALSISSLNGGNSFAFFALELAALRYRNGIIDGYPSRLHYFTDWLRDNERKGYLRVISDSLGNARMDKPVNFMTSNPQYYRQLQDNPSFIEAITIAEKEVSGYKMKYITKDVIDQMSGYINEGDIIAFVTTISGLDISHTGLAVYQNGKLHLLHASTGSREVEITREPLSVYLQGLRNVSGIVVARVENRSK